MADRPLTAAEILDFSANLLDQYLEALVCVARARGEDPHPNVDPQADLRVLAAWLRQHPEVDANMHVLLSADGGPEHA